MRTIAMNFLSTLTLTLLVMPFVLWALRRRNLVDRPNERSSHADPTLRGGGVAAVLGIVVVTALSPALTGWARVALLIAAGGFGVIGLADDLLGLDAKRALVLQLLLAAAIVPPLLSGDGGPSWLLAPALLVWIVSFTNAFNFMDGINGISSVQAMVAGGTWWLLGSADDVPTLAAAGAILAGAGLGFLPFNFPRARVFLGSVGSYAMGAFMAVVVIAALRSDITPEAVLAPLALYLADTGMTLVRRAWRRERWWEAHCDHTYQRLVRLGWSHVQTSLFVGALLAACSLLGLVATTGGVARVLADAGVVATVIAYLATPTLVRRERELLSRRRTVSPAL